MAPVNPFKLKPTGYASEIISGASRSFIMKILGLVTAYIFAFAVARYFGADAWGEFSLALSVILFGAILGTAGLDVGMVKITAGLTNSREISSSYAPALMIVSVLAVCCSIAIFFLSDLIAGTLFNNPELTFTFRLSAFAVLPLSLINLNAGILQGLEKINKYVFIRFVARHLGALLLFFILLFVWQQNQSALIAYIAALYLIAGVSFYWLIREDIRFQTNTGYQINKIGDYSRLLKISTPLLLAGSLVFLNSWIDTILIGVFLTEMETGVYNIALKMSGLILFFLTSVNAVVTPKFSETYTQNKTDKLREIIRYSTSLIFYCTIPLFLILILFSGKILAIFGEEFVTGKYALIILSFGSLISAFSGSVGYIMQMTDSQIAFQNITLASLLIGFLLNLILIPKFGIEGAAAATCISTISWNATGVLFVRYKYNIITYYQPFLKWRRS